MIDTQELGAGSYPDVPEDDSKMYEAEFYAVVKYTVRTYADTKEIVENLIEQRDWDEIIEEKIDTIELVKSIREVK